MGDSDNSKKFTVQSKTAFIKSDKTYIRSNRVNVVKEKDPPKRTEVTTPLTKEHRYELRELVNDWVTTSNLAKKPLDYGKAYVKLYADGLHGEVNGIEQIEDSEFEQCRTYIRQRIMILEAVGNQRVIRRKSDWRKTRISTIHARISELIKQGNVTEERRKEYQSYRYGHESVADFSDDDLEDYRSYLMSKNPKFTTPREKTQSIQQIRENALRVLMGVLEANTNPEDGCFNPKKLTISKPDMLKLLENRHPDLFGGMSIDEFNNFWKKQQILKCKVGTKLGSGAQ